MESSEEKSRYKIHSSQWKLFFTVLVIGCAGAIYGILRDNGLQNSAALYVGLPMLLALGLSLTPKAKSSLGATMKGTTIALLLAAPVFREGYICILFAAPIFYLVGALMAWAVNRIRKGGDKNDKLQVGFVSVVLAISALEGTNQALSFPREHDIIVTKIVAAPLADVRDALSSSPEFDENKPFFLRIFPYPVSMEGEGLEVGDVRRAKFVAYKYIFWNRVEGDAVFTVTESTDTDIVFSLSEDTSYVGHYVGWKTSQVQLMPVNGEHTQVTWKLSFHRKYDPYWYFGTLQKYAVNLVASELIDHAATPRI